MTRINTNINSLTAQQNLSKTSMLLQTALTRLSTGLRINSGKDDPAGMIAAAQLGSDIAGTNAAIGNSKMGEMIIDTADSALGQITSLVNDIRTLVTQAANSAAMSPDQIAANQLQINSSLDAINRISQSTNFQGRKLIDGSLDFTTTHNLDDTVSHYSAVQNLQIDTADSGLASTIPVTVSVSQQAQKAYLTTTASTSDPMAGTYTIGLDAGTFNLAPPAGNYSNMTIKWVKETGLGAGNATADYASGTNTLTITVDDAANTTYATLQTALAATTVNGDALTTLDFAVTGAADPATYVFNPLKDGQTAVAAKVSDGFVTLNDGGIIEVQAKTAGAAGNIADIVFANNAGQTAGTAIASYNSGTNTLTITVRTADTTVTTATMAAAITSGTDWTGIERNAGHYAVADLLGVDASTTGGADAVAAATSTENSGNATLAEDVVFLLTGNQGAHLFDFKAGTDLAQVASGINQWSDGTGVTARTFSSTTTTNLVFESSDFGSAGTVRVDVQSGGTTFKTNLADRNGTNITYSAGTDIQAKVNGVVANGVGNTLSIDTPALAMSMTVNDPTVQVPTPPTISFTITGGGAHFQIGPNVVSTQKAVIGIQAVDTAHMNTIYGKLYQLHSGETADLSTDLGKTLAGKIITAVAGKIATLRGRLGAFSKTTMETNIATLGATVNALTNAQSQIQDADFAAETASLTRAQVLTQSGTAVLQIANRGPQNVLALLQNL